MNEKNVMKYILNMSVKFYNINLKHYNDYLIKWLTLYLLNQF